MKFVNEIGKGTHTRIFEYEGTAVKQFDTSYNKAAVFYEASANAFIENTGLPVPKVYSVEKIDDKWTMFMQLIDGITIGREINEDLKVMAELHYRIHCIASPLPVNTLSVLNRKIEMSSMIDEAIKEKLIKLLESLPFGFSLCHMNFHGGKVIKTAQDELFVLDWIHAGAGVPECDVCKTYTMMYFVSEELAEKYLEHYCRISKIKKSEVMKWLPVIACDRLYEAQADEREQLMLWINLAD